MKKGIDVSEHQSVIDWEKVKSSGIEFVMIRAGYGNNHIDNQFIRNISECNRLNIPCGVYWFSYALNTDQATREAQQCIAAIKPYKVTYPVVFDLEYDTIANASKNGVTIGKQQATDFAMAFCTAIENAGHYAMIYTNQDYAERMFDKSVLNRFALWYAWYASKCNRNDVGLWQYTSSGSVPGIFGNVDMNYALKEFGVQEVKKVPNQYSYDDVVNEMIIDKVTTVENMVYWEQFFIKEPNVKTIIQRYQSLIKK